jgi:hypothetical protein
MGMRVGFASGTRPGPPIEERKSLRARPIEAPPRREAEAGPLTLLTDWSTRLIPLYLRSRMKSPSSSSSGLSRRPSHRGSSCVTPISFGHDVTCHMTHRMEVVRLAGVLFNSGTVCEGLRRPAAATEHVMVRSTRW